MLWVLIRIASLCNSNEYPQHMFLWRTDEIYPSIIIKYPLICSPDYQDTGTCSSVRQYYTSSLVVENQ